MEKRYTFLEPKLYDALPNGRIRVYYDEVVSTETVTRKDEETGVETTESYTVYSYRVADAEALERTAIIIALIRADYSADDELAIQRQKDDKPGDYNAYNAYVEKCKAMAARTLNGDTLDTAKAMKIADLSIYDASPAVNSFTIGDAIMWLSPDRRSNLKNAVEALRSQGVETVTFMGIQLPADTALQMLAAIESYAAVCSQVTDSHRAAISELGNAAEVARYDFTVGYPEHPAFEI